MDPTEPDCRGVGAELVDGLGEAFGVKPGGLPVGTDLVDALSAASTGPVAMSRFSS